MDFSTRTKNYATMAILTMVMVVHPIVVMSLLNISAATGKFKKSGGRSVMMAIRWRRKDLIAESA